jgi:hypothetical protein
MTLFRNIRLTFFFLSITVSRFSCIFILQNILFILLPVRTKYVELEPLILIHFKEHGSKRLKMKYGLYDIPAVNEPDSNGMVEFYNYNIPSPCSRCYIMGLQVGLEYTNGLIADTSGGVWLHHVVIGDITRNDLVCLTYGVYRFFASGNERTRLDMTLYG